MKFALPHIPAPAGGLGTSDVVDVLATALLVYYLLVLMRGTRAVPILFGIVVLAAFLGIANIFHLLLLATVLQYALLGTAVALPVVFQPELRRLLEGLGRGGMFARREGLEETMTLEAALAVLARAAVVLANNRIGALVAIEGATGLREYAESGTRLDAKLSVELLLSVFNPRSPLHDGAAIVRGGTIDAAGCFLPLSENVGSDAHLGTRHRAAIGVSEQTDATVLIVSEQSGAISLARAGRLSRESSDEKQLRGVLLAACRASRHRPRQLAASVRFARRVGRRLRRTGGSNEFAPRA